MRRAVCYVESRRSRMLAIIRQNPDISAAELAEILSVSEVTIRRDLRCLEDQKYVVRKYGSVRSIDYSENSIELYRVLIARYAASMIEDEDTIFINTSSTALQMLRYISAKNITVITNNARAVNFDIGSNVKLVVTGGELSVPKFKFFGDLAQSSIMRLSADKAFLGCAGLTANLGMTTETKNEVLVNRLMWERTVGSVFVIADHTKIGHNKEHLSLSAGDISNVITDELVDRKKCDELSALGISMHIVERR